MPLPPGFSLTPPGAPAAGGPNLPPGFSLTPPGGGAVATTPPRTAPLQQPAAAPASGLEQTSQFATGFDKQVGANLNPISVLKSLLHPIDTYNADWEQRKKILGQAEQDFNNGHYGSAAIRSLDGMVPILGPMISEAGAAAASNDRERQGRAVGNIFTLFAAPEAVKGAGGVLAKLAPKTMAAVSQAASDSAQFAADRAGQVVDRATTATAEGLNKSARRDEATMLNPTTKVNKALVEKKLAQGLLDRKIVATSLENLQAKAQAGMEKYGQQIDDVFDQHAEAGTTLSPKPIIAALEKEKQGYVVDGVEINKPFVKTLSDLQDQVQQVSDNNGGQIPVGSLRAIRQIHDRTIAQSKNGFALAPDAASQVEALKAYTNAIRSSFAEQLPELVEPNKEFSFHSDLNKVVGDTIQRKTGQRSPLTQALLENTGTIVGSHLAGGVGAILGRQAGGALARLSTSTLWKTLKAATKAKIASMLDSGDEAGALALAKSNGVVPATAAETPAAMPTSGESNVETTTPAGTAGEVADVRGPVRAAPAPEGQGDRTAVTVPGKVGPGYAATYRLRELNDINASHNGLTFSPNREYKLLNDRNYANANNQGKVVTAATPAAFDARLHITDNPDATNGPIVTDSAGHVLGGNGRTMILQRVFNAGNPKSADAYRSMLEAKAPQFGIDPAAIAKMKEPVLVREIDDAEFGPGRGSKQDAVTDFNKTGTAGYTPGERTIADSRRVSDETLGDVASRLDAKGDGATLAQVLEGKGGLEVLDRAIKDGVIAPQERATFATDTALTKAGRDRLAQLVVGRFFRDPAQLDAIAPSVRGKVERLAAPIAQVESKTAWALTDDLKAAVDLVEAARQAGIPSLDDFIKQDGLFGKDKYSPKAITLARALKTSKSSDLVEAARQYAQDAAYSEKGEDLLGNAPTPESSFEESFGALKSGAASEAAKLKR